ncbi:hypothetical protein GCM10009609_32420 [Pseudonocardia aurantiaca]|uniref:Uncharacterized protein n=1 Tax=Pseudonocardia aurantiaca TaxID=75290 RepID=A0ABW4FPY5_9PSEU
MGRQPRYVEPDGASHRSSAEPTGPDPVRLHMRYMTLDGDTVLDSDWWVLAAEGPAAEMAAEMAAAGLDVDSSLDDLIVARRPAG